MGGRKPTFLPKCAANTHESHGRKENPFRLESPAHRHFPLLLPHRDAATAARGYREARRGASEITCKEGRRIKRLLNIQRKRPGRPLGKVLPRLEPTGRRMSVGVFMLSFVLFLFFFPFRLFISCSLYQRRLGLCLGILDLHRNRIPCILPLHGM